MKQQTQQFNLEQEENRQTARILSTLIRVTWMAYLFVIITNLYYKDWLLITVTLAGGALLFVPWVLLRRGHLRASSFLFMLSALLTVTILATVGQGIRDIGIVAFPIIFIFAGLTLDSRLFRVCVGLALVAVSWLALGETYGWFVTKPYDGEMSNWFLLIGAIIIFLIAALAVDLLSKNMRRSLEMARQEIGERKRAEEALRLSELDLKEAQSIAHIGSWKWDVTSGEVTWSDEMFRIFGIDKNSHTGRLGDLAQKLMHPDDLYIVSPANAANIANAPFEYRIIRPDSAIRLIRAKAANTIFDQDGKPTFMFGVAQDITESRLAEEQLRFQGTHDALTGLFNRNFFEVELARLEHSRDFPISMIVADVDRLKFVNDTRGHALGDQLLWNAADVLSSVFRDGDLLARIGGDEFAVLLPATQAATAEKMLARVRERLAQQNSEHPDLPVQLSLGMATAEKSGLAAAFTLADQHMYVDKAEHKAKAAHTSVS